MISARTIVNKTSNSGKTSLSALMGLAEGTENKQILSDGGIPHYPYAEPAIRTLKAITIFPSGSQHLNQKLSRFKLIKVLFKKFLKMLEIKVEKIY